VIVALVASAYVGGATAQWAWKEDNGRVVYSDRPPPATVRQSQILRQPPGSAPVAPSSAPAGAPSEAERQAADARQVPTGPKTLAERDMEFRKRQQERAEAERKAQEEQQKSAAKAADCERSKGYLRALEDGVRITRTDGSGNREYLDDAQRAAEIDRTRKTVQQVCG
jgi:hypothetical protein